MKNHDYYWTIINELMLKSFTNSDVLKWCFDMNLTLVLLNWTFRHLKLELLTQFPASNDVKYYYLWKIDMSKIKLLDQLTIY